MASGVQPRRSSVQWGVRILLVLIVLWCAWYVTIQTTGYVLRTKAVERAYALAPNDARVAAAMSQQILGPQGGDATIRARADRVARAALLADPTSAAAAATLGLNAELRGDRITAQRAFAYAQLLSRRELRTQLWAIENAVGRNDVPRALKHYDIALRTSRYGPDLLFPVLGSAIADATIRNALIQTLATRPIWGSEFVEYVAGNGPAPQATAQLLRGLQQVGVAVPPSAAASVINALVTAGHVDDAWSYYAARHPGADRRRSRDDTFTGETQNPSAFDWVAVNDGGRTASIQGSNGAGILDFSAPPSIDGVVAQQMQWLPAGRYTLRGKATGIDQPAGSRPFWVLSCAQGQELGRVELPSSGQQAGAFAGTFVVPTDCPVQILALTLRSSDTIGGVSGQISFVQLQPAT